MIRKMVNEGRLTTLAAVIATVWMLCIFGMWVVVDHDSLFGLIRWCLNTLFGS